MVCKSAKLPLKFHHHNYSSAEFVVSTMLAYSYKTKVVQFLAPLVSKSKYWIHIKVLVKVLVNIKALV